jgi:uncharacterized pyridoxal phosphate-containing UPF0001 family protein
VPNLVAVETIDSEKIATKLESACISADREAKLIVYIQVIDAVYALYIHMACVCFARRRCYELVPHCLIFFKEHSTDTSVFTDCFFHQVDTSGEDTKSGIPCEGNEVTELARYLHLVQ